MTLRVPYGEDGVKDGMSPMYTANGMSASSGKRRYRVAGDRFTVQTALQELVGYSYVQTVAGVRKLRRELPETDPYRSPADLALPRLYCTSASVVKNEHWAGRTAYSRIEQIGDPTLNVLGGYPNAMGTKAGLTQLNRDWKSNLYNSCVIEATFGHSEFSFFPDTDIDTLFGGSEFYRFTTTREDRSVRSLTLPQGSMFFVLGGTTEAIPFSVPVLEFESSIFIKQWQVNYNAVPWLTIRDTIGKINFNRAGITIPLVNYAEGTLLYLPPKVEQYPMANDQLGVNIEHCLLFQPVGWGKLLRAASNSRSYKWVTGDATLVADPVAGALPVDKYLYNSADLSQVFIPNNP